MGMDKKINVLHLVTSLNIGGTEKYLLSVSRALKGRFNFQVGYIKQEGLLAEELRKEDIPVHSLDNLFKIYRLLKKNKIHLLHTHLYRANILGRIAGMMAKTRIIISSQRSIDDWKKPRHILADKWTAGFTDCIIANALATKNLLVEREKIPPNKIKVVYNGVDTAEYMPKQTSVVLKAQLKIDSITPVIGYIGRLHREKGADYLPEIALRLKRYIAPFKLLIIGEGPLETELKKEIERQGLTKEVSLIGVKQNILDFIYLMDLVILPSREESLPQIVLEAMKMAKPVVVSDVGGVREIVTNGVNGIVVHSGDLEVFSQSVYHLLRDQKQALAMGQAGRENVIHNFSLGKMISETENIYNNFINIKIR
jgi:glycosyltransferase involved in cell wall biosynthesis